MHDEQLKPCPRCPDGYVWNTNGPTGATCPVCLGYAAVTLNGDPIGEARPERPEYVEDYR